MRFVVEHQAVVQDTRHRPAATSVKTEIRRLITANDAVVQSSAGDTGTIDPQVKGNDAVGNGLSLRRTINSPST